MLYSEAPTCLAVPVRDASGAVAWAAADGGAISIVRMHGETITRITSVAVQLRLYLSELKS